MESKAVQMKRRLENCWEIDIVWELYARHLLVVSNKLGLCIYNCTCVRDLSS